MERGFDKLMTPMGINLVAGALLLFFVIIAAGGVTWRLMEVKQRAERDEKQG
jgi:hypothetical protein